MLLDISCPAKVAAAHRCPMLFGCTTFQPLLHLSTPYLNTFSECMLTSMRRINFNIYALPAVTVVSFSFALLLYFVTGSALPVLLFAQIIYYF